MTDAGAGGRRGSRPAAVASHLAALWAGFVLVHLVLGVICLTSPSLPMGDVSLYAFWVHHGLDAGVWVGIDTAWVYPLLALVPMILSAAFGWTLYASTWLTLVMVANAIAFAVLLRRGRRAVAPAAWWWIGFLLALGPVALARIDAFATAAAIVGVLLLARHPVLASVLLAVGAWIKVWPAALVAGAVVVLRERLAVLAAAAATTAVVLVAGIALGGGAGLVSFVTQQSGRGLQIEAPLATVAMWTAWARGGTSLYYDRDILTYQLQGPGVELAAALSTPLLAVATAAALAIAAVGVRRRRDPALLLPPLLLALVTGLILFNKVGSPQFAGWIAAPVILGLVAARLHGGRPFLVPAVLALAIAGLTQFVYPYLYGYLLGLDTALLLGLTIRNALYAVLFAWAIAALVGVVAGARSSRSGRPG